MNLKNVFYIETERLLLRRYSPDIMQAVFTSYSDDEIMNFLGLETEEALKQEKIKFKGGYTTYRISFCGFHLINKTDLRVMGMCGFHNWYAEHFRSEFGYALLQDTFKRKGYMKEAIGPILQYGFNEMNLNRIEAFASPTNAPSIRLLEHFGFEKEGLLKQHFFKNGVLEDSAVYGLFKANFK